MKKPHTGGFLKSPFNMYEGSSIDSGSHKQATEQKGEECSDAGCAEKKRALLLSADFTVCPGSASPEKGDHPEVLFTIPCFFLRQQHNRLRVYEGLSVNKLPTKLQAQAQLPYCITYKDIEVGITSPHDTILRFLIFCVMLNISVTYTVIYHLSSGIDYVLKVKSLSGSFLCN